MDYLALLYRYYPEDNALRRMLLHHSRQVCTRALQIVDRHPELGANRALVEAGAMLHDIGIFRTDAPGIYCHGTAHYLLHGIIGAQLLREEAELLRQKAEHEGSTSSLQEEDTSFYEALARICERHTGTGLRAADIRALQLPLPAVDLLPETVEERIICYADLFHSKSHPLRFLTAEQVAERVGRHGEEGLYTFRRWQAQFE